MNKYILYIGMNDKDTKKQNITVLSAREIIMNTITATGLDGATISEAVGIYKHEDGTIITEQTLRVEILFATDKHIKSICDTLKQVLNQESIAVEKQVISSTLM